MTFFFFFFFFFFSCFLFFIVVALGFRFVLNRGCVMTVRTDLKNFLQYRQQEEIGFKKIFGSFDIVIMILLAILLNFKDSFQFVFSFLFPYFLFLVPMPLFAI